MSGPDSDYGCIELGLPDMEPHIAERKTTSHRLTEKERENLLIATKGQKIHQAREVRCQYFVQQIFWDSGKRAMVGRCGLFVDLEYPWFAASPDGLDRDDIILGSRHRLTYPWFAASPDGLDRDDSILEVKCTAVASRLTPEEAVKEKKV
ncbi:hypothetical protein PR048_010811 [Dryococelus australis]|uniref:YqaJ viral recombinase domain-containing protein n=1 Tax=Dryococelus australis TaxID=614101 RepID=A0ABQ9I4T6_9NEOP|nr:hypothetical protein PR048_010811 [Dryococelus australis]